MNPIIVIDTKYHLAAEWHGGPYIDIHVGSVSGTAIEVINVWDYDKDVPSIPREPRDAAKAAVVKELKEWAEENYEDYARNVIPYL